MARARRRNAAEVRVEHLANGTLDYIVLSGVIDESFNPGSLVAASKAPSVVINCAGVIRFSSFGVRQWLKLIDGISRQVERLYFVECSPKFIDEANMVGGFTGPGKVISFYAPYVCRQCETARNILFRVDLERDMLRRKQPPNYTCRVCEGQEFFDDDPNGYLVWFDQQGELDVDEAVLSLLQGRLDYSPSSQSARPHVEKHVEKQKTFIAIRGTLDGTLPTDKIVSGLEGDVVVDTSGILNIQASGLAAWDTLLQQLNNTGVVQHVYFSGVPPLALERGAFLGRGQTDRFTVLSVTLPFTCESCGATAWHQFLISSRRGEVTLNDLPKKRCVDCNAHLRPFVSPSLLTRLTELPPPAVPGAVKRFIKKAPEHMEAQRSRYQQSLQPRDQSRQLALIAVILAGLVVLGGVGAAAAFYFKSRSEAAVAGAGLVRPTAGNRNAQPEPQFTRPDWISSDQPGASYCFDTSHRVYCVGVSSYRSDKKEALNEAWDASLEGLVNHIALQSDSAAIEREESLYFKARQAALAQAEELRKSGDDQRRGALDELRKHHADVAASLRLTGGPAAPSQQSDSYWEEYERNDGAGTDFLGFVEIEVSNTALEALIRHYSKPRQLAGAKVVPAFPGLAWKAGKPVGGAFVLQTGGSLDAAGAKNNDVIERVGGAAIEDIDRLEPVEKKLRASADVKLVRTKL